MRAERVLCLSTETCYSLGLPRCALSVGYRFFVLFGLSPCTLPSVSELRWQRSSTIASTESTCFEGVPKKRLVRLRIVLMGVLLA